MSNRQNAALEIAEKINRYIKINRLLGLNSLESVEVFSKQIVDSIRRISYIEVLENRTISSSRIDPNSSLFDPLRAALYYKKEGNFDEAFWLVFLATHFGKSQQSGWTLCSDIYGALGEGECWSWDRICADIDGFRRWYDKAFRIMSLDTITRRFSNHRKYESLNPNTVKSIPNVFQSYINWIGGHNSHIAKIEEGLYATGHDSKMLFNYLYKSIEKNVVSFGRLAAFDYVTMLSKLGLIKAYPQIAYLKESSGPRKGASLLYYGDIGSTNSQFLEEKIRELAEYLELGSLSMQIMEDSLCNWQKSPNHYKYFKG